MTFTPEDLLLLAIKASIEAGEDIMRVYRQRHIDKSVKADQSPVTEADHAAHERINRVLSAAGIPVMSEEGREIPYEERKTWQRFWLVDPLDGTKEFIKRNGEFTVNIALVESGMPMIGVILVPDTGALFFGGKDFGSFRILRDEWPEEPGGKLADWIREAASLPLPAAPRPFTVVASRSHVNSRTWKFIRKLAKKHRQLEKVSRGSALKFCIMAEGRADVYPRFAPTWEWDTGAGQALVEAAGCRLLVWPDQHPMQYNKEILTNPWFIVERISQGS